MKRSKGAEGNGETKRRKLPTRQSSSDVLSGPDLPLEVGQIVNGVLAEYGAEETSDSELVQAVREVGKRVWRMMKHHAQQRLQVVQNQLALEQEKVKNLSLHRTQPSFPPPSLSPVSSLPPISPVPPTSPSALDQGKGSRDSIRSFLPPEIDPKRAEVLSSFLASPKLSSASSSSSSSMSTSVPSNPSSSSPTSSSSRSSASSSAMSFMKKTAFASNNHSFSLPPQLHLPQSSPHSHSTQLSQLPSQLQQHLHAQLSSQQIQRLQGLQDTPPEVDTRTHLEYRYGQDHLQTLERQQSKGGQTEEEGKGLGPLLLNATAAGLSGSGYSSPMNINNTWFHYQQQQEAQENARLGGLKEEIVNGVRQVPQKTAAGSNLQTYFSGDSTASTASPRNQQAYVTEDFVAGHVVSAPPSQASAKAPDHSVSSGGTPDSNKSISDNLKALPPPRVLMEQQKKKIGRSNSSASMRSDGAKSATSVTGRSIVSGGDMDDSDGSGNRHGGKWTEEQNQALLDAVEKLGPKNWKVIAQLVPGRDHVQCLQRWGKVLKPGLKKGQWSEAEDKKLISLVNNDPNPSWGPIADQIPGRTAKQCRERWSLNLDPSINRSPWSAEEDALLLSLQEKMGSKWAEIKCQFKGRTENSVKTRYKSLMRLKARAWTPDQDKLLLSLCAQFGKDWKTIAANVPGRTRNAVKTRVKDLLKDGVSIVFGGPSRQGDSSANKKGNSAKRSSLTSPLSSSSLSPSSSVGRTLGGYNDPSIVEAALQLNKM